MFEHRSGAKEVLDERMRSTGDSAFLRQSYRAMFTANRHLGSLGTLKDFIFSECQHLCGDRPLRVLDVGAGDARVGEELAQWAYRRGIPIELTCLDANRGAVELARKRLATGPAPGLRVLHGRIGCHLPVENYDCAMGSLFFHHFTGPEILDLLAHLRRIVRRSVVINDLRRSPLPYMGLLGLYPFVPPAVWRDALLSVRRGFRGEELRRLLKLVPDSTFEVEEVFLFRVVGRIRFTR